jgi:FdhD protein
MENEGETIILSQGVAPDIVCYKYIDGQWRSLSLTVPKETALTIYINDQELVTILCTPVKLNCLVLGYLLSEGIIRNLKDVVSMRVCEDDATADVKLAKADFALPQKKMLTSGCGGGVSFVTDLEGFKSKSAISLSPENVLLLMKQMMQEAELYNLTGGIHTSAISDGKTLLAAAEDIGRHNTLDKIIGECLLRKISTSDKIMLTSGRVSSEMMKKAAKMQAPVVVSLTSPTERAVLMARELEITLAGYARGNHLTVYSRPERLGVKDKSS